VPQILGSPRTSPALRWAFAAVILAGVAGTVGMGALRRGGVSVVNAPWIACTALGLACAVVAMLKASADLGSPGVRRGCRPEEAPEEATEPDSVRSTWRTTAFTALAVGFVVFCASAYFLKRFVEQGGV